jgi:phage virion morphogenesis protein
MSVDVALRENVSAGLARLREGLTDMTPVFKELSGLLEATTVERFDTNVDPDGVPWKPSQRALGQTTPKKRGGGQANEFGKTLVESGDLRSSITSDFDATSLTIGVEASFGAGVYAAIHQFGGQAGRNKSVTLPARAYLGLSDTDDVIILDTVADYLEKLA